MSLFTILQDVIVAKFRSGKIWHMVAFCEIVPPKKEGGSGIIEVQSHCGLYLCSDDSPVSDPDVLIDTAKAGTFSLMLCGHCARGRKHPRLNWEHKDTGEIF